MKLIYNNLRKIAKPFFAVKTKALFVVHKRAFERPSFYFQFWMSWYMIIVSLIILMPPDVLRTIHLGSPTLRLNETLIGLVLLFVSSFQLCSMTSENRKVKVTSAKLCLGAGIFMTLISLPVILSNGFGLGVFVFAYYTFHEARILADLSSCGHTETKIKK